MKSSLFKSSCISSASLPYFIKAFRKLIFCSYRQGRGSRSAVLVGFGSGSQNKVGSGSGSQNKVGFGSGSQNKVGSGSGFQH